MNACAALERWQRGVDSPVAVSQYAVAPRASTRAGSAFVLPAQRPPSPEIAESPTVTTAGVPTPGPSAAAGALMPSAHPVATTRNVSAARIGIPPEDTEERQRAYAALQRTATFIRATGRRGRANMCSHDLG